MQMSLEKKYLIVTTRFESKEVDSIELLDESSQAPVVKTAVFRIGKDDYKQLGYPPIGTKLNVKIEVVERG